MFISGTNHTYFENIKYLRLETATFPRYYLLKYNDVSDTTKIDTAYLSTSGEKDSIDDISDHITNNASDTADQFKQYINTFVNDIYKGQYVDYVHVSDTNITAKFNLLVNDTNTPPVYTSVFSIAY